MQAKIEGNILPVVTCKLAKGETVITENGGMSWMDENIEMETSTNGGILKGIGRALAGETIFMNRYTAKEDGAEISFASSFPGNIIEIDLKDGESVIAQKRAFLCSEQGIDSKMHVIKKVGAGFWGGEGFIMQKISGTGKVFLEVDGSVFKKELKEGEKLRVDNGYLVAMTEKVQLDIEMVHGIKNKVFGGEGIFITNLKGPGTVWLQSMPLEKLSKLIQFSQNK